MNPLEEDEESWPDEPDEFDPDSLGPDPPDTSPAETMSAEAMEDIPDGLFRAFWASVLFLNVALAATALGVLLIYFRGDYGTGGPALLVGVVAALSTGRYYWRFKTGKYADEAGSDDEPRGRNGE